MSVRCHYSLLFVVGCWLLFVVRFRVLHVGVCCRCVCCVGCYLLLVPFLLFVCCCLLYVVCCSLFVVGCLLCVVGCLCFVAGCLIFVIVCCLIVDVCVLLVVRGARLLFDVCSLRVVV